MIATRVLRTLDLDAASGRPHLSAASGLVRAHERFYVVADDENDLGLFPADGAPGRLHTLLDGELPARKAERKARKADFEILCAVPGHGLLAMGSGSRPTRERAVLLRLDAAGEPLDRRVIDTSTLCRELRPALPELNLEGALLLGDAFVLLQRASRKDPRNALVFIDGADLQRALQRGVFELSRAPRIVDVDLLSRAPLPWSFTDAVALDDGDLLATIALEDTADSYEDGACTGSGLARISARGDVRWLQRLDTASKVEGIAIEGDDLWLVTDADDAAVAAQLLHARIAL